MPAAARGLPHPAAERARGCARDVHCRSFVPTWSAAEHAAAVEQVRAAIGRGDVYQVNLVQHLRGAVTGAPRALAAALRRSEPSGPTPSTATAGRSSRPRRSSSCRRRGDIARTMPIKGTRPAGPGGPIAASAKDRAEHVMIVDLERNDLGRVCLPGSVRVAEYLAERPMAGVRHMVSTVEGRLRPGVGLAELLRATFPGGSVTGAPKLAAIDHIARSSRSAGARRWARSASCTQTATSTSA